MPRLPATPVPPALRRSSRPSLRPGDTSSAHSAKSLLALFLAAAAFAALVLPQLGSGASSGDLRGIVQTVNRLLSTGVYASRPPGHPFNEIYVATPLAFLLRLLFHLPFTSSTYLVYLFFCGLACLVLLFALLRELRLPFGQTFACLISLGLSPTFLRQTLEGQDFLPGLACVLASSLLLLHYDHSADRRTPVLLLSAAVSAFATGFRPELALSALLFPVYFAKSRRNSIRNISLTALAYLGALLLSWLPALISLPTSRTWLFPIPHDLYTRILAAGYKILFQAYPLAAAVILLVSVLTANRGARSCETRSPAVLWYYWASLLLGILFLVIFVLYPTKPELLLVTIPFFLVTLALGRRTVLLTIFSLSIALSPVLTFDIFEDRRFVGLHLVPGPYRTMIAAKPRFQVSYLESLLKRASRHHPVLIVGRFEVPVVDFYLGRGGPIQVDRLSLPWARGRTVIAFTPRERPGNLLFPMSALEQGGYLRLDGATEILRAYQEKGFDILVDRSVFSRWRFQFVAPSTPLPESLSLDGVDFTLF